MAQPKVIKYELEGLVLGLREKGRSNEQMAEACSAELAARGIRDSLTKKAVERYLATLDRASVAPAHAPAAAAANATLAVDVAHNLQLLDGTLRRWLDEAEKAVTPMRGVLWDPYAQKPADAGGVRRAARDEEWGEDLMAQVVDVFVPDWQARLGTAKELRQHAEAVANILQRVHDAEQVQAFQEAVMEAIGEASPDVAAAVIGKLRDKQQVRRAALLGAAA